MTGLFLRVQRLLRRLLKGTLLSPAAKGARWPRLHPKNKWPLGVEQEQKRATLFLHNNALISVHDQFPEGVEPLPLLDSMPNGIEALAHAARYGDFSIRLTSVGLDQKTPSSHAIAVMKLNLPTRRFVCSFDRQIEQSSGRRSGGHLTNPSMTLS